MEEVSKLIEYFKKVLDLFPSVRDIVEDVEMEEIKINHFGQSWYNAKYSIVVKFTYDTSDLVVYLMNKINEEEKYNNTQFKDRTPAGKLSQLVETFSGSPSAIRMGNTSTNLPIKIEMAAEEIISLPAFEKMEKGMGSFQVISYATSDFIDKIDELKNLSDESLELLLWVRYGIKEE